MPEWYTDEHYDEARDIAFESYMADESDRFLYDQHVSEYKIDQLKSFYLEHPDLCESANKALETAKKLLAHNPTASLIFATICSEVTLKKILAKPVAHGLINDDIIAELIANAVIEKGSPIKLKKVIMELLKRFGEIDLKTYKRIGSGRTLLKEIEDMEEKRNRAVHEAEEFDETDAKTAIEIASELLLTILPKVLDKLGIHQHGLTMCGWEDCKSNNEAVVTKA